MTKIKKYINGIENIDKIVKEEYDANKKALLSGRENVENCIKDDIEQGFDKSYFSTRIEFYKNSKEFREQAIESACIRMLAFKKFLEEELGYNNIEIDVIEFDNYTTHVRAIVQR